jgi:hypothetical protein
LKKKQKCFLLLSGSRRNSDGVIPGFTQPSLPPEMETQTLNSADADDFTDADDLME